MNNNETTTPKHVPVEVANMVTAAAEAHELHAQRLIAEGQLNEAASHVAMIGYYTGLLQMLTLAGYEDPEDPYLEQLLNFQNTHTGNEWNTHEGATL